MSGFNLNVDFKGVGDLTKPLSDLIAAIQLGAGIVYEPTRIRRLAKAEAEAAIIREESQQELAELRRRADIRLEFLEDRRQQNIEQVAAKAIEATASETSATDDHGEEQKKPDPDWLVSFFQHCQDISNEELQALWAHVLSGECRRPGSYSLRTLSVLRNLDRDEAETFQSLAPYIWYLGGYGQVVRLESFPEDKDSEPPPFGALLELQSAGLIDLNSVGVRFSPSLPLIQYSDEFYIVLELRDALPVGNVVLTRAGEQLSQLLPESKDEGYRTRVLKSWGRVATLASLPREPERWSESVLELLRQPPRGR